MLKDLRFDVSVWRWVPSPSMVDRNRGMVGHAYNGLEKISNVCCCEVWVWRDLLEGLSTQFCGQGSAKRVGENWRELVESELKFS